MILFKDWMIQVNGMIARQYDNLSRRLDVIGELPEGWSWELIVRADGREAVIELEPTDGGAGVTLTRDQLSIAGYYSLQLRGTKGDVVKHTNIAQTFVPESLTGTGQWPSAPGGATVEIDKTLTKEGAAADAKAVGEKFSQLSEDNTGKGFTNKVLAIDSMIDLTSLGVKAGSIDYAADNSAILQEQIETYPTGGKTFYLPAGTYHFDPIDLTGISGTITVRMKGQGYGLDTDRFSGIQTTIITNKQDFLYDKRNPSPGITFYVNDMRFHSYQGYSEIPTGVCFGAETNSGAEYNFHFHNVYIHGFDYGFRSPGYSCGASGGRNFTFSTCHYGIWINAASHMFYAENMELLYNRVGVRLSHGGSPCSMKNIHVATGYLGADRDDFDEFLVFHTKGDTIIEKVYYEAYESSAQPAKTILFDFEGWAYGCGPLTIRDVPIGNPGGAAGALYLRARGYLGAGPETGAASPIQIYTPEARLTHYPNGLVKLINCSIDKYNRTNYDTLLAYLDVFQDPNMNYITGIDLGKDVYVDGYAILKDFRVKVDAYLNRTAPVYTNVVDGDTYLLNNANAETGTTLGFNASALLNIIPNGNAVRSYNVDGYLEVTADLTSSAIDVDYGFASHYRGDGTYVLHKFYPIARLTYDGTKKRYTAPFQFEIDTTDVPEGASALLLGVAQRLRDPTNNADGLTGPSKTYVTLHYDLTLER